MSQHTILVIGATGTVGAPVARQLRAAAQFGSGFEYIQGSVE